MRQRSVIQKRYDENEVQISNLTEKYSLGKIDDDVYTQMIDQFKKRRHGIHNQLLSFGDNVERSINELGNDFKKVLNVANRFENGSIQEKKEILQNLQSNLWLVDGNLLIDLKPSFLILSQRNRLQTVIEPQKNRSHKGLSGFPGSKIQRWCTMSALIRTHLRVQNWLDLNGIN